MSQAKPTVVLSWGLGVDSTTILVRWLTDPSSRDFDLGQLLVVTAMVGDEFADTGRLVRDHALPLLAAHQVRWVQLARRGPRRADGIEVLSDTCTPTEVHLGGSWKLSDELLRAGTVPQYAHGRRICSTKFKGEPIERFLGAELGGLPYRHVIGFNADEQFRVERDRSYKVAGRDSTYPLLDWGWGRQACEEYLHAWAGEPWARSCCKWCPFAGSVGSLPRLLERYRAMPDAAADGMFLEAMSLAFNPNVSLFAGRRLLDAVVADANTAALSSLVGRLAASEWALYDVRRIIFAAKGDPARKGPSWRKVTRLATGSRPAVIDALAERVGSVKPSSELTPRVWLETRGPLYPTREHLLVAAPAVAENKARPGFDRRWELVAAHLPAACAA